MKNSVKAVIFIIVAVCLMAGGLLFSTYLKRVPPNTPGTVGNTAGNINNSGLFAEDSERVYFSNSYDHGYIYSMNADETDIKKFNASASRSILVGDNHIYYYMDTANGGTGLGYVVRTFGIYRTDKKGKNTTCLDRNAAVSMQLVDDYIYYQRYNNKEYTKLYRIKTDKTDMTKVSDAIVNPASAFEGNIYYNGTEKDHYLYKLNTKDGSSSVVYQGNVWYPQYVDGYVYFMEVGANYRLCRYSPMLGQVEILTNDRVDTFNVGNGYIYYQKNDSSAPALMRMRIDGSNPEVVLSGNYNDINLTSKYAYFKAYGDDTTIYHTPVDGPLNVGVFTAALEAVAE